MQHQTAFLTTQLRFQYMRSRPSSHTASNTVAPALPAGSAALALDPWSCIGQNRPQFLGSASRRTLAAPKPADIQSSDLLSKIVRNTPPPSRPTCGTWAIPNFPFRPRCNLFLDILLNQRQGERLTASMTCFASEG